MEIRQLIIVTCVFSMAFGQNQFSYDPNKVRTSPVIPRGNIWSGVGATPPIPGERAYFDSIEIVKVPGQPCRTYLRQTRGAYNGTDNKLHSYYPFTAWVKNCDISRFLWCKESSCNCFPGMYWRGNATLGKCVAGYQQNCSLFRGYDFQIKPTCGRRMLCKDAEDLGPTMEAFGEKKAQRCVCDPSNTELYFKRNDSKIDMFRNPKYDCELPKNLRSGESCSERKHGPNSTVTDCGDYTTIDKPGGEIHIFCKFPATLTGGVNNGVRVPYGSRQGGRCQCTDANLRYRTGVGCLPRPGMECRNNIVTFNGWNKQKRKREMTTSACGNDKDTFCTSKNETILGRCICQPNVGLSEGLCDSNVLAGTEGGHKEVGSECHFETDPCNGRGGQECINSTCLCQIGWVTDLEKKECQGLYGAKCDMKGGINCFGDTFECRTVRELSLIDSLKFPESQTYCVCKNEYLYTVSGKCDACALNSIKIGFLILKILIIKNMFTRND